MKIVKPSYQILQCPDGEAALALIEFIGRKAYKSEDKIDDGMNICPKCLGSGRCKQRRSVPHSSGVAPGPFVEFDTGCIQCGGVGRARVREPSSHKFVRTLLKSDRREQLKKKAIGMSSEDVVDMTLDDKRDNPEHESVIEHLVITVAFVNNRGWSHEAVRHRLCAFTQSSTRYCNYSQGRFGGEIQVTERSEEQLGSAELLHVWMKSIVQAEEAYMALTKDGVKAEIARDLLPTVLATDLVITANLREWRHIFRLRASPRAHPDMRNMMRNLLTELRHRVPIVFDEL